MCGIAGFRGRFDGDLLRRMTDAQTHRGPDDSGYFFDAEAAVGLGHRRLSIIDLSPTGHQPMWDARREVAIVFNGEIYNFRELAADLRTRGVTFRGTSDTEVLLALYIEYGADAFRKLNGMFAFAIFDRRDCSLTLARDHMGVKPLYYHEGPEGLLFASELRGILTAPHIRRDLSPTAAVNYLKFLWCPAPETLLAAVKKLEPGMAMSIGRDGQRRSWRFAELPTAERVGLYQGSETEAVAETYALLERAVDRQMVADVPVGCFLSGGLDSSILTYFAREHAKNKTLDCFSVVIPDGAKMAKEGFVYDYDYAQRVAKYLGVALHPVEVSSKAVVDNLETMVECLEEPMVDPGGCISTWFISRAARAMGYKVLLSGLGGDDVFAGYRRHVALQKEGMWSWMPGPLRSMLSGASARLPQEQHLSRRVSKALRYAGLSADARMKTYYWWLDQDRVFGLLHRDVRESILASYADPLGSTVASASEVSPLNKMLLLEQRHFLADFNLIYADKMSMAASLEVRVPFLDHELVNFAARLPPRHMLRGTYGKWVLRRAMEGKLPQEILYRSKTGFGVPLRSWVHEPWFKVLIGDTLSPTTLARRGLFDADAVTRLVQDNAAGTVDATYSIVCLVLIELWARRFVDGSSDGPSRSVPLTPSAGRVAEGSFAFA